MATMARHPLQQTLRAAVAALVPGWTVTEITEFEFLPWGYSNRNFRFRYHDSEFVLRLPQAASHPLYGRHPYVNRELERALYEADTPVHTPDVIAFDTTTGNMISRWLDGSLLADEPPSPDDMVRFIKRLHDALPGTSRVYDPLVLSREYLARGTPHADVLATLQRSRWSPPVVTTCHNDLNPWNVIRHPRGTWITLDWEWFGANDPLFDLVTLHQGLGLDNRLLPELAEFLVEAPVRPSRLADCLTAFWLREYAWAHAELIRGNAREEVEAQREFARERLSAL